MNLLGIDPGSRNLGYCILKIEKRSYSLLEAGIIKIKATNLQEQIIELVEGLDIVFKSHLSMRWL